MRADISDNREPPASLPSVPTPMTNKLFPPDPDAGYVRDHASIHDDLLKANIEKYNLRPVPKDTTEVAEQSEPRYFGKDCPKGMVQVEFVGVDPKLRYSDYGWKPSERAFLEVWVDGRRFRIDVGNVLQDDGTTRRGIHVVTDWGVEVNHHSVNALDVLLPEKSDV